jgi:molybdate/tungstate transport system permease protein
VVALAAGTLVLFLVAPVAGLVARGGAAGARALVADAEVRSALAVSALAALGATAAAVLLGTPLAWLLARRRVPLRPLVEAALDLPLVLPHPVAGLALLLALGRGGPAGGALAALGVRVLGTPLGAAAAMLFVAAPLYVSAARASFAAADPAHELAARTLGAGPWRAFRRVSVPLAARGLLAGAVVTWARAVSEFGAVVVLAYHPRTAATLAYERFTGYGLAEALPVAAALVLVALGPLALLRGLRATR